MHNEVERRFRLAPDVHCLTKSSGEPIPGEAMRLHIGLSNSV